MNTNKMLFRGIKVGILLVMILLIIYGTMKASFWAYDFGYRYAMESLVGNAADEESTESTESKEE